MRYFLALLPSLLSVLPLQSEAQRPEIALIPELRIGSLDQELYSLSWISDLEVSADGRIYVAQPQEKRVRVFGPNGRFRHFLGRSGSGPGEFQGISEMGWYRDSLYVVDPRSRRVTIFSKSGEFGRTIPVHERGGDPALMVRPPVRLLPDGTSLMRPEASVRARAAKAINGLPILRLDSAGAVMDTLLWELWRGTGGAVSSPAMGLSVRQPLRDHDLWEVDTREGTIVRVSRPIAETNGEAAFEVSKVDLGGREIFRRRFRYQPQPVSRQAADSLARAAEASILELLGPRGQAALAANEVDLSEELVEALAIPGRQPPISQLLVGSDGSIWLRREELRAPNHSWLVLGKDGRIQAEAVTSATTQLFRASDSHVWGVEKDEFDVPYVVRFRIGRAKGNN